jgi:leucyl-tRNA---protein transferase
MEFYMLSYNDFLYLSMFAQVHCPNYLPAEELDRYLEQGWFRMGQTIFTTSFLNFKKQFYSAVWLRVDLQNLKEDKTRQKLFRINNGFRVEFGKLVLDERKNTLYEEYRRSISFEASATLHQLLFRDSAANIYDSEEVTVYDGERLIAAGVFDNGRNSAAGIISFYDPAYRKYSLGKYLIYLKIHYCKNRGMRYFYPGYFVPGYFSFDYKLAIGRAGLEYFDLSSARWFPIDDFQLAASPLQVMRDHLEVLKDRHRDGQFSCSILKYEFFDVNLAPDFSGAALFDFPLFLVCNEMENSADMAIVFDVRDNQYHLLKCRTVYNPAAGEISDDGLFSHLLMIERDLYATPSAAAMQQYSEKEFRMKTSVGFSS